MDFLLLKFLRESEPRGILFLAREHPYHLSIHQTWEVLLQKREFDVNSDALNHYCLVGLQPKGRDPTQAVVTLLPVVVMGKRSQVLLPLKVSFEGSGSFLALMCRRGRSLTGPSSSSGLVVAPVPCPQVKFCGGDGALLSRNDIVRIGALLRLNSLVPGSILIWMIFNRAIGSEIAFLSSPHKRCQLVGAKTCI
ncbi:hypothetical protein Bca4012_009896 [Brassica carinata]